MMAASICVFVYAIIQILIKQEIVKGTALFCLPIGLGIFGLHIISLVAKPSGLKYQQAAPLLISRLLKIIDLVLIILAVLIHYQNFESVKIGLLVLLVGTSILLLISSLNEMCYHFEKVEHGTRIISLMHFLTSTFKLLSHVQMLVLVGSLRKIEGTEKVYIVFEDSKTYLLAIPTFIIALFAIFAGMMISVRLNKEKELIQRKVRYHYLGVMISFTVSMVCFYVFSLSEISSAVYFNREMKYLIPSVVLAGLGASLTMSGLLAVILVAKKHGFSVISPDQTGNRVSNLSGPRQSRTNETATVHPLSREQAAERIELNLNGRPARDAAKTGTIEGGFNSNVSPENNENLAVPVQIQPMPIPISERGNTFSQLAQTASVKKNQQSTNECEEGDDDSDAESVNFVTRQGSDLFVVLTQTDLKNMMQYKPTTELSSLWNENQSTPSKRRTVIKVTTLNDDDLKKKREKTRNMMKEQKAKLTLPSLESMAEDFDLDVISPKKVIHNRRDMPVEKEMSDVKKLEITLKMFDLLDKKHDAKPDCRECRLCCDNTADVVFMPCGHGGVCFNCFLVMIEHNNVQCFYCRLDIAKVYKLDVKKTYKDIFRIVDCFKIETDEPNAV